MKKLTSTEIKAIFNKTYNGQVNGLTPNIHEYGQTEDGLHLYEISYGSAMFSSGVSYAVTILTVDGEKTEYNQGGFGSVRQCKAYIKDLFQN